MSDIKAIEKLRELLRCCGCSDECYSCRISHEGREAIDAIEREIADRYVKLPLDADGVPIRVGDRIACNGDCINFPVYALETNVNGSWCVHDIHYNMSVKPQICRHVKERTVEDVLRDCGKAYYAHMVDNYMNYDGTDEQLVCKYANEIRKLMKEGGDA